MTDTEIFQAVVDGTMTTAEGINMLEIEHARREHKFKKILRIVWIMAKNIILGPLA